VSDGLWEVPTSWAWAKAGEVAEIIGGGTPAASDPANFDDDGTPWITPADLSDFAGTYIARGRRSLSAKGLSSSSARVLPKGAVLFSSRAPIGYCVIAANPISTNQGFKSLVLMPGVLPEYVRHYLLASVEYIEGMASGTTFKEISGSRMAEVLIPIPPLAEQRRIVARIEALFARTRQARADLLRIAPLGSRHRIAAMMEMLGGATRLATSSEPGPAQPPADPDMAGVWPFDELPSGWEWRPFSDLFDDVTSSHNKLPQKAYQPAGLFPVIDQGEAEVGGWSDDGRLAYRGSFPAIIFGDHTRAVKFVERPFIQGADGVKVLVVKNGRFHPRFAFWALKALPLPDKGYSRHTKFLRASFFPVPPLAEQERIAQQLDALHSSSRIGEHEATRALALLDHLEQAILAKAFRGELVPQDQNDEPANALLARLRADVSAPVRRGRPRRVA